MRPRWRPSMRRGFAPVRARYPEPLPWEGRGAARSPGLPGRRKRAGKRGRRLHPHRVGVAHRFAVNRGCMERAAHTAGTARRSRTGTEGIKTAGTLATLTLKANHHSHAAAEKVSITAFYPCGRSRGGVVGRRSFAANPIFRAGLAISLHRLSAVGGRAQQGACPDLEPPTKTTPTIRRGRSHSSIRRYGLFRRHRHHLDICLRLWLLRGAKGRR